MKKGMLFLLFLFMMPCVLYAETSLAPLLDTVRLQLQDEQWVTSKTALVNVMINASVTDHGIETLQNTLLQKLTGLAKEGEWHIVSYDRTQDKSGLESIQIMAQARLPQSALVNLRQKAKNMSKAGETYTIDSVQFTPSNEEMRLANQQLRANIYQQAKAEMDALNKQYPDQKYYLHQIDFMIFTADNAVATTQLYRAQSTAMASMAANPPPLKVGNKLMVQAMVTLASMPTAVTQKLTNKNP